MNNMIFIDNTAVRQFGLNVDEHQAIGEDVHARNNLPECAAILKQIIPEYCAELQYINETSDDEAVNCIQINLDVAKSMGTLNKYVIITAVPARYSDKFISNNVIDVSKLKSSDQLISQIRWILDGFHSPSKNCVFVWSDPHFSHKNIIRYCNRPWNSGKDETGELIVTDEDVKRMNEDLIKNYNSIVRKDDIVYCLGDFAFGDKKKIPELVSRLNGKIRLVKGNHDRLPNKFYLDAGFDWVYDRPIIINDYIVLSHAPLEFIGPTCPWFNCYGHVHGSESYQKITKTSCCACVEKWDYKPVKLDTIKSLVNELNEKENA